MTTLLENGSKNCPRCGAPFGEHAQFGFCSRCVASVTLAENDTAQPSEEELAAVLPRGLASSSTRLQLGEYELLEEIARGGMGVVYRARQRSLNRIVAVKMLLFPGLAGAERLQRFRNEAAAAAALEHANIVRVLDVGEHEGQPFLAMEFVAGADLAQQVRERPLPSRRAAGYVAKIARAIAYAHQQGILHRDLKPSNVLLDAFDEPRVTDFGLARNLSDDSNLTVTGQAIGSPNFMPPEQASGDVRHIGPASDVYGLGAILYHLLTSRPPFLAETFEATITAVREREAIPPRQLNGTVPRDLETICLKCLEKEPARRYQSARELADELDRFLKDEPIHARPISRSERAWRWCRGKPALAASIFLVLLLFLLLGLGGPIVALHLNQSRATAVAERQRAETSALEARRAQYASDMNLAHQAVQDGDFFRARQLLERHAPVRTTSTSSLTSLMDAQTRESPQPQPPLSRERVPGNPDAPSVEKVRDAAGTRPYQLLVPPASQPAPGGLALSPGHIRREGSPAPPALDSRLLSPDLRGWEWHYLWNQLQGEEKFILGTHSNGVTSVGFLPDGQTVFSAGLDGAVRLWDFESRRETGAITQELPVATAAVSPDSLTLATAITTLANAPGHPLRLWDLRTKSMITTVMSNHWPRASMAFSPDGRYFAFAGVRTLHLWDTAEKSVVTNWPYEVDIMSPRGLAFSPDGRMLAFNTEASGRIRLWDVASRSFVGALEGHSGFVTSLAFSPDGMTLASGSGDASIRIWDVALRRTRATANQPIGHVTASIGFSPGGDEFAATFWLKQQVVVFNATNGQVLRELVGHQDVVTALAYSPDGRHLLTASRDGTVRVWDAGATTSVPSTRVLGDVARWNAYGFAESISPDGHFAVTVSTNGTFSLWNTKTLTESLHLPLPSSDVTSAAVAPGGGLVAFGLGEREIQLWESATREARPFATPSGANVDIARLAFSSDGKLLAAAGSAVWVYDVATAQLRQRIDREHEHGGVMEFLFADRDRRLLVGCFNGTIQVYDLNASGQPRVLRGHTEQVRGMALLDGGRTLISVAVDSSLRVWDLAGEREIARLSPRRITYLCAALSPDGRRFAAGAGDGSITLWDTESLHEVARLKAHEGRVQRIGFTADGDNLISLGHDKICAWRGVSLTPIENDPLLETKKGTSP